MPEARSPFGAQGAYPSVAWRDIKICFHGFTFWGNDKFIPSRHVMSSSWNNDRAAASEQLAGRKRPANEDFSASEHIKRSQHPRRPSSASSRRESDSDRAFIHPDRVRNHFTEPSSPALASPGDVSVRTSFDRQQTDVAPLSHSATGLSSPAIETHPRPDDCKSHLSIIGFSFSHQFGAKLYHLEQLTSVAEGRFMVVLREATTVNTHCLWYSHHASSNCCYLKVYRPQNSSSRFEESSRENESTFCPPPGPCDCHHLSCSLICFLVLSKPKPTHTQSLARRA